MVEVPETQALHLQPALKDPAARRRDSRSGKGGDGCRPPKERLCPFSTASPQPLASSMERREGFPGDAPKSTWASPAPGGVWGCQDPQPHLSRSSQSSPPQRSLNSSVFIPPTRSKSDL